MSQRVVVLSVLGIAWFGLPKSAEAQRIAVQVQSPAVSLSVRTHSAVRIHAPIQVRHAPVGVKRSARAAAIRCDLREDIADAREDRRDRAEDIRDAREDRRDRQFQGGLRDRLEDIADRAEDRRDRAEDVRDAREDRWDATHVGCR